MNDTMQRRLSFHGASTRHRGLAFGGSVANTTVVGLVIRSSGERGTP